MELQKRGIVNGVQKGIFAPNAEVTRAQFMKMLAGVAGAQVGEPDKALPFTDVAEGSWYTPYVAWAYQTGVVNGVSATSFAPDAPISRQQICAMLQRLAEKHGITLPEKTAGNHIQRPREHPGLRESGGDGYAESGPPVRL